MKTLSIRQPWVWSILYCGKPVENRSWYTSYRGPVLLHASKGMTLREYYDFYNAVFGGSAPFAGEVLRRHNEMPEPNALQRGGIVGYAEITDCVKESTSPWFFGPWGFVLANVRPLPFRPCKGALGFFEVDYDLAEQIRMESYECSPAKEKKLDAQYGRLWRAIEPYINGEKPYADEKS